MSRLKKNSREGRWHMPLSRVRNVADLSEAELLVRALQEREMSGHVTYAVRRELLARFDAAPLHEKERMLGEYWPKWEAYVREREHFAAAAAVDGRSQ